MDHEPRFRGRLELTWTNKHQRLHGREDDTYEWVDRADFRVAEVRLLHEHSVVGEVRSQRHRARDNLLIRGDALHALRSLAEIPEWAAEYAGKVRLADLDPPFNTGQAFAQYDDGLEHSVWLTMIRDRLEQIKRLLAPDGSVWLHLDDAEAHRARCVLDEVFGPENFVATVIWQKIHARNNSAQHLSVDHDYLHVYAKDRDAWHRNRLARTDASDSDFWNPDNDPRGLWRRSDLTASHPYADGRYEVAGPHDDRFVPREGRWWSVSRRTFDELRADNRLWWGRSSRSFPFRKRFQTELPQLVPTTIWPNGEVGNNREAKAEVTQLFGRDHIFATPKPERLLQRIIHIATDPGDLVLDCFVGSGTTPAVAHKMGRRWVAVEWSAETVATFTLPRLSKVMAGDDRGGISKAVEWHGAGGFRLLDVAPSMYEPVDGSVFLAGWATNGALAEACAAQLGCRFQLDGTFCGRKGRTRLAVVDGLVDEHTVRMIVGELGERERVVIAATANDPAAKAVLHQLSPGSRLRKVPDALLRSYVRESRLNHLAGREPTRSGDELVHDS